VIESDDEDEAQEPAKVAEETQERSSTQEQELMTTTKKLKLDPTSPKKPKAQAIEENSEKHPTALGVTDDPIESADKEEAELEAAQADDIEQAAEAVEIKQAAAKWQAQLLHACSVSIRELPDLTNYFDVIGQTCFPSHPIISKLHPGRKGSRK